MTIEVNLVPQSADNIRVEWPSHYQSHTTNLEPADHFIVRNGVECAGTHIIIDLWGAQDLDNLELMEQTMREAIACSGATLLHIHLHHFTPNAGISGVAVLAESHISVHTWPERNFAAFDVFMCGDAKPEKTIPVLQAAFKPDSVRVHELLRGANIQNETIPHVDKSIMNKSNEANDETF